MGYSLLKDSASRPLLFLLVSSVDHITGLEGATPTVTISKSGAAMAASSGAVSEIGKGWYQVAGDADDRDTAGPLALHAEADGADPYDDLFIVGDALTVDDIWARIMGEDDGTTAGGYLSSIRSSMALLPTSLKPTSYSDPAAATANANITIIRGDDYTDETADALRFVSELWPDLQDAEIRCTCRKSDDTLVWSVPGEVVTYGPGSQEVKVELTHAQTDSAPIGSLLYDVQATWSSGRRKTLVRGSCTVLKDYTWYPI